MSDTGLTVPGMNEPPSRYDVTVTVDRDGGTFPGPGRVRRGSRQGRIEQERQRCERAHGRADHQRGAKSGAGIR